MFRYDPLLEGEFYHVYNRGAHKRDIFLEDWDYRRFQLLMHILNHSERVVMRDILNRYKGESFVKIYEEEEADHMLVDIIAYCLMPNHFHLVLRQKASGGITQFMKKLATAYSMYFNLKHEHSGTLFQGPFKSKHVGDDSYLRWLLAYVHLNPLDIIESGWKEKGLSNIKQSRTFMNAYRSSSFFDYSVGERAERKLLAFDEAPEFLRKENDLEILLRWLSEGKITNEFT